MVARATPGFSGAGLADLVSEAAIQAVRAGRTIIEAGDVDTARDRLLPGRRETSNALLAALCPSADPIAKVTVLGVPDRPGTAAGRTRRST